MERPHLFLGFLVTDSFAQELEQVNPHLRHVFIQNHQDYLQQVHFDEKCYLGKYLDKPAELPELQLLEANIYSLLAKLVPEYPYDKEPLRLFSLLGKKH